MPTIQNYPKPKIDSSLKIKHDTGKSISKIPLKGKMRLLVNKALDYIESGQDVNYLGEKINQPIQKDNPILSNRINKLIK